MSASSIVSGNHLPAIVKNLTHLSTIKTSLTYGAYAFGFFAQAQEYLDEVDIPKNLIKNVSRLL